MFTVSVHPLLHGHRGACFIHRLPAHLSGHLLLLQVTPQTSRPARLPVLHQRLINARLKALRQPSLGRVESLRLGFAP